MALACWAIIDQLALLFRIATEANSPRLYSVHDNETAGPPLSPDRIVTRGHRRTRHLPPCAEQPTVTRRNVRGQNVEVTPSIQHRFPAVRRAQRQKPTLGTHSASHDAISANRAHPGCA
jgi:hypothetical protein